MNLSPHFILQELVSPEIFKHSAIGERSIDFINVNAVSTLEDLRGDFGAITINDWHVGGNYKNSGLRSPTCSVGAIFSAHRFGTGFDLKFSDHKAEYVYFHILNNQGKYPFISRMENAERTRSWLHIELSTFTRNGDIVIFNP